MKIALITDIHFGPEAYHEGKLRKLTHRAGELTEEFVARMNDVEHPDLVVNLGDVIEDAGPEMDEAAYRRFVEIVGRLEAEVLHVAGNHDSIHLSDEQLAALWGRPLPLHYSRDVGGFHLAVLRSREVRDEYVELPEDQVHWLEQDLRATELPSLVFVHHPLGDSRLAGNRWFERRTHLCRARNRRRVREVIEMSGKVLGVFNGHAHWNHLDVIREIPYVTLQSLTENLDDDAPGRPARAHAVVELDRGSLLVRVEGAERARYQFDVPPALAGATRRPR